MGTFLLLDSNNVDGSLHSHRGDFLRRDIPRLEKPISSTMAEQPVAEVFTFPTDPAEFENDDRISFSKLDNKFIAVQESDGTEFEFDQQLKRWIPVADEDEEAFIQQHQNAYGNAQDPSADSSAQPSNGRKRKQDQVEVSCARWSVHGGRDNPCTLPRLSQVAFMIAPDGQCRRTCNGDQKQQYLPSSTAYGKQIW